MKPSIVPVALGDIKKATNIKADKLFLSIAMGVPIKKLEQYLPSESRVIRVMPNTPALVRSGASVFISGHKTTDNDIQVTTKLLQSIGTCEQVTENYLDAITALSGSGPAYVRDIIQFREEN